LKIKDFDKKLRIMNAARELFYEKNFNLVSMDDIARKASVGKGTIYNYFKSKDDLLLQLAVDVFSNFEKGINFSIEESNNVDDFIKLSAEKIFENVKVNSKILFLFHKELYVKGANYKDALQGYRNSLLRAFDKFEDGISVSRDSFYFIITNFLMTAYIMSTEMSEKSLKDITLKTLSCALKK
jgi:AcrR family transcriptional regulator